MSLIETNTNPAPVLVDPNAIDRRSGKPKQLTKRMRKAIDLLATGECRTIKAASERSNMNYEHLWRMIHSPQGQAFINRRAAQNIGSFTLRASHRMGELLDAESEHVSAKVAERILEDQGVLKVQSGGISVNINNNIAAGYVVDLGHTAPVTIDNATTRDEG